MKTNDMTFDAIAFKRRAQVRIADAIEGMTPDEEIDYFRTRAESGALGEWWQQVKRATAART